MPRLKPDEAHGSALVLGASRGIGRAISERLLQDGYRVIGAARSMDRTPIDHPRFTPHVLDLADTATLPDELKRLQRAQPGIEQLICCAGRGHFGALEEFSYQQIRSLMDLNFLSHAYAAKTFLPLMKQRGQGHLVFIGSEAALVGKKRGAIYCASKFALRGLAQALREECAGSGVKVTLINPGMVRTGFFDGLEIAPGEQDDHAILPEEVAATVAWVLAGRAGTVIDEINLSPQQHQIKFAKQSK